MAAVDGKPARPLFEEPHDNPPLREAIDFYRHAHGWSNRLIAGDSLLVMNSLLEKEGMAGKVQMVYIDPPYGIEYASNFQPFVDNRTVKDRDSDLSQEPETIRAFPNSGMCIHSYLGSFQSPLISPSAIGYFRLGLFPNRRCNLHLVRAVLDETFGPTTFWLKSVSERR